MKHIILLLSLGLLLTACQEELLPDPISYDCELVFPEAGETHPKSNDFQAALDELKLHCPAAQVAVHTADGLMWTSAYGMADIPNQIPLQSCSKSMVGSISKMFTAVLILQLADEGILSVEDRLGEWLADSIVSRLPNGDEVQLSHLLKHTSGIPDYLSAKQYVNSVNQAYFQESQREKLRYIYDKSALFGLGERYSYSNTNYVLLGLVVEKARAMPLWEAVDKFISQPLGLENTVMGTHDLPIPDGTARSYRLVSNNKYQDVHHIAVADAATGDGGIASNTQELVVFIRELLDGQLLSDSSLSAMLNNRVEYGEEEFYGLGIDIFETSFGQVLGHNGSTTTYNSFLFHFPILMLPLPFHLTMRPRGRNGISGQNLLGSCSRLLMNKKKPIS